MCEFDPILRPQFAILGANVAFGMFSAGMQVPIPIATAAMGFR